MKNELWDNEKSATPAQPETTPEAVSWTNSGEGVSVIKALSGSSASLGEKAVEKFHLFSPFYTYLGKMM